MWIVLIKPWKQPHDDRPRAQLDFSDPNATIWAPCPDWIQSLARQISLDHPNHSKADILQIVVPHILRMEVEQDLDGIEVFSGHAEATKAFRRKGYRWVGYDEKYSPHQDIVSILGLIS